MDVNTVSVQPMYGEIYKVTSFKRNKKKLLEFCVAT